MPLTGQKSGYLEVKVPSKVRGKGIRAWKAWKRRWVVLNGLTNMVTQTPMVTIDMYLNEGREGHQLERSTIYLEKVVTIIRTPSKSHLYAFGVEAQETILYLSGHSEGCTQSWISALRSILWPPTSKPTLDLGIGKIFNVSIIESLSTSVPRSLMISTVGYMITLPSVILLASLSTGCILVEWPWSLIEKVLLVEAPASEDEDKVLFVDISKGVPTSGSYYFFSDAAQEIYATLSDRLSAPENGMGIMNLDCLTNFTTESSLITQCKLGIQISTEYMQDENIQNFAEAQNLKNGVPITKKFQQDLDETCPGDGVKVRLRRRRQSCFERDSYAYSFDNIPIRTLRISSLDTDSNILMQSDRRKSVSDSILSSSEPSYGKESQKNLACSRSGESDNNMQRIPRRQEECVNSPERNPKKLPQVTKFLQRPVSIISSTSQASRDSGVMMSQFEESHSDDRCTITDESKSEQDASEIKTVLQENMGHYHKLTSDLMKPSTTATVIEAQSQRLSSSSDNSLYSEIDNQNYEDPLYEDLDKFRKNLHKLLGIPTNMDPPRSPTSTLKRDVPPPLPPRKYKKELAAMPPVKHKDVMKYLGVDACYGSLDKLSATHKSISLDNRNRRKDIYRYLGIPSMAASQPTGLNNPELMYDCPPSVRFRKNSVGEVHNPGRRTSRTYVRVQPLQKPPAVPEKTDTLRKKKKKKISFLKRKTSLIKKQPDAGETTNSTYISYDTVANDNWEDINSVNLAIEPLDIFPEVDIYPENSNIVPAKEFIEEWTLKNEIAHQKHVHEDSFQVSVNLPDVINLSKEQKSGILTEQYAVPAICRKSIVSLLSANELRIAATAKQPYYVNLSDLNSIKEVEPMTMEVPNQIENQEDLESASMDINNAPEGVLPEEEEEEEEELDGDLSDASVESNYMDMSGTIKRKGKHNAKIPEESSCGTVKSERTSEYYVEVDSLLLSDSADAETDNTSALVQEDNSNYEISFENSLDIA